MSTTSIPAGSPLANKQYSKALAAMVTRQPTPLKTLTGAMPQQDSALRRLAQKSTNEMPVVQVDELTKGPGDVVQVDCVHVTKLRAIMGDKNAEGQGAPLKFAKQDVKIDAATLPVSAGGQMTQQRTPHSMRAIALAQLKGGMPRFRWQRAQVLMAGARGSQDGTDWILPLSSDPEFAEMLVNTLQAPTYNRHLVANGATLTQGGAQAASLLTTDTLKLSMIDELAAIWDEMVIKMAPIQIPGDPAAGDDPIKGILFMDPLAWDSIMTDTTASNNIRTFETNAMKRAAYDGMRQHPLFAGSPFLWNGILVRKMSTGIRFNPGDTPNIVTVGNRLTATETTTTVPALAGTHVMARSLFLGAQALACASGANAASDESYSLLENRTNFERNLEFAGEIIGGEIKLRFNLPNSNADLEPTDFGVLVIDSAVRSRPIN